MRHVSHTDRVLLIEVSQEGTLVIDFEVEDAVLVGQSKSGAVDGGRISGSNELQVQAVEGREHGEFELEVV